MPPLQQTEAQRQATFQAAGMQPAAQAPVTPAPTIQTPATPGATPQISQQPSPPPVQVNVNNGQPQANQPAQAGPSAGPLAMPGNGSVVDLLNAAGTDSSFANRSTLAQQYGIQGYTGTADQNKLLSKKYLDAFNANKDTKVPDTGAQAASALDTFFQDQEPEKKNPEAAFFDAYSGMNPVVKTLYDTINKELSSVGRQVSFTEQYQNLVKAQGIEGLQTDLLNIERIMDGTDDDIRDEITKVGGFATESQVQALTGARNKTLLKQANFLQKQLTLRNDYVKQVMELTQADRKQVEADVDRKLGLTGKLFELSEKMTEGAKNNYQKIVDKVGYQGLADAFKDDPQGMKLAEKSLGLPIGALSTPAFLAASKPATSSATSIQEYEYAKKEGYKGTYAQYQNEDANRKAKAAGSTNASGLTNYQTVNTFNRIVDKFNASPLIQASDRTPVLDQAIKSARTTPSNGSVQLNLVYSYIQALDTYQSAVREGELGLVSSIDSSVGKFNNIIQQVQNGQIVRPEVIKQIADASEQIVNTIKTAATAKAKGFQAQADVSGVGPEFKQFSGAYTPSYAKTTTMEGPNGKRYEVPNDKVEAFLKAGGKKI